MRSRCVNKYFATLLVLSLLGLAFAGPRTSRAASEKGADKRVQDSSSQENVQESQKQDKFDESKSRVKRQVIAENNDANVLEDVEGTDLIQKLGVDGRELKRVKRQGDWRDHPYYRDRYEDSESSDDPTDDDSTATDSDSTTDDSEDSTESSDSSSDSDDERRRRRRRRRRDWWNRRRYYNGGWGDW